MSGFTEKFKDAVRIRSKHRHSKSLGEISDGRSSADYGARKSIDVSIPDRGSSRTSKPGIPTAMGSTGGSFQAKNIYDKDGPPAPAPPLPTHATQHIQQARPDSSASPDMNTESPVPGGDAIPPRHSSMPRKPVGSKRSPKGPTRQKDAEAGRIVGHKTTRSLDVAPDDPSSLVPRQAPNSVSRKQVPTSTLVEEAASGPNSRSTYTSRHESIHRPTSSDQTTALASFSRPTPSSQARSSTPPPPASQTANTATYPTTYPPRASSRKATLSSSPTSQPQVPISISPPTSPSTSTSPYPPRLSSHKGTQPTPTQTAPSTTPPTSPQSYPPRLSSQNAATTSTTQTHVHTTFAPAATTHTQHAHTTSITHPVITRDIHIDHYYHYTQPVQLPPTILPAKHYHLDPVTNVKTKIPAPEGWVAPSHLRPTGPGDVEGLEVVERHYVVDERSPEGRWEGAQDRVGLRDADPNYGYGQEREREGEVWSDAVAERSPT